MDTNSFALGILIALSACLANVSSQRERCLGNYCSGSFGDMKAICKDGYCYCTGQDYDYNTCLPDAYGCRIEVHSNASPAIPRYNNQQPSTVYSCTPKSSSSQYEVHVMSVYEGNRHTRPPSAGDTNVNIVSSNKSGRPIILVFGSYEPVNWILNLPANITISKVILVAYYIAQSSVRGDMNQVQAVERKTWQWGIGYGSDTGGGDTVALLRQVHSLFGVVTSFTGTYKADHWSLTLSSQGSESVGKYTAGTTSSHLQTSTPTRLQATQYVSKPSRSSNAMIDMDLKTILLIVLGLLVGLTSMTLLIFYRRRCKPPASLRPPPDLDENDFKYDVFVTYSRKDFSWVDKELLHLLRENQVKYCVDHKDFELGKAVVDNITDSVYQSRKVLAVWSGSYASSKYCKQELDYAIQRSFRNSDCSVIVITVDKTDRKQLPKPLRGKTFLDYSDSVEKQGWEKRLIRHLKAPNYKKNSKTTIV